jgi:hypothetical protein
VIILTNCFEIHFPHPHTKIKVIAHFTSNDSNSIDKVKKNLRKLLVERKTYVSVDELSLANVSSED